LLLSLALGCGLLACGLLLRRRTSTAGAAVEFAGEPAPLAGPPGPSPRIRGLPSRHAIVLRSTVLLAWGVLSRRQVRRR
jgi:hypothetical protein